MVLLACTCSGIAGYYYGKKEQVRPIVIEYEGHKNNMEQVFKSAGVFLSDDQKESILQVLKSNSRKPVGFQ